MYAIAGIIIKGNIQELSLPVLPIPVIGKPITGHGFHFTTLVTLSYIPPNYLYAVHFCPYSIPPYSELWLPLQSECISDLKNTVSILDTLLHVAACS